MTSWRRPAIWFPGNQDTPVGCLRAGRFRVAQKEDLVLRRGGILAAIMMGLLLLAGCAAKPASPTRVSAASVQVEVGATDNGRTVTLSIGDDLVLDAPIRLESQAWTLAQWPKSILSLPPALGAGGPARFPYTFTATRAGTGVLVAVNRVRCDVPPKGKAKPDPVCLITDFSPAELHAYSPEVLFSVTVVVPSPPGA